MIKDYINDLCDELNIDVPFISHDTSVFPTETTLAMCHSTKNRIYIRPMDKPTPDLLFSIAHELRHIWQIKTDETYYFKDYKNSNELTSDEYNLQIAELDANAYATIVMIDDFGLQPLFNGLSDRVINAIYNYIEDNF